MRPQKGEQLSQKKGGGCNETEVNSEQEGRNITKLDK